MAWAGRDWLWLAMSHWASPGHPHWLSRPCFSPAETTQAGALFGPSPTFLALGLAYLGRREPRGSAYISCRYLGHRLPPPALDLRDLMCTLGKVVGGRIVLSMGSCFRQSHSQSRARKRPNQTSPGSPEIGSRWPGATQPEMWTSLYPCREVERSWDSRPLPSYMPGRVLKYPPRTPNSNSGGAWV